MDGLLKSLVGLRMKLRTARHLILADTVFCTVCLSTSNMGGNEPV